MSRTVKFAFRIITAPNVNLGISHLIKTAPRLVLSATTPTALSVKTTLVTVKPASMDLLFISPSKYANSQQYKTVNPS